MLNTQHRLYRGEDFRRVLSRGKKHRTAIGVVAVAPGQSDNVRFGFVVSKAVGNAVVRNRVKRRLRAAASELVGGSIPIDVVVRSQPGSERISVAENRAVLREAMGVS